LAEDGFISDSRRAKSVAVYEEGVNAAKEMLKKYGIE
jgi:hypothetical protein